MFYEMKKQMKEQQLQSDREQEHMTLDRENNIREQEELNYLTNSFRPKSQLSKTTQLKQKTSKAGGPRISMPLTS